MELIERDVFAQLIALIPFGIAVLLVYVAVFSKAARKFPFQPKEP
ncbi:MAG: hypothetical protein ACRD9R_20010 [Pyrinomonadaceae bacterium]